MLLRGSLLLGTVCILLLAKQDVTDTKGSNAIEALL